MSSRKVRVDKESKEERVARVGLKQTIIATALTALLTAAAAIIVAVINKPVSLNAKAEIQYFKAKAKITSDDFVEVRIELEKAQEETDKQLAIEKEPEKIKHLKEAKLLLRRVIEENTKSQKSVEESVERSLVAIENEDRVGAAIYRKVANDRIDEDAAVRQNASLALEKAGLQRIFRQDVRDVRDIREVREVKDRLERDVRLIQHENSDRKRRDDGLGGKVSSVERPERPERYTPMRDKDVSDIHKVDISEGRDGDRAMRESPRF